MANPKKTILADPASPDRPLNSKNAYTPPPQTALTTTVKSDWKSSLTKSNSASIGLYAKFLALVLGAGVDASVNWAHETGNKYEFDKLETTFFDPMEAEAYLEEALRAPNVARFIEKSKLRKPVYVITGLKIVRGGKIKSSKDRARGGTLSVGLDGTALAAPVEVGPEFELQKGKGESVEWGSSDDFVFAYRLSRIKVKRRTGEMKEEEYVKGALYGLEGKKSAGDADAPSFEISGVEGDSVFPAEFGDVAFEAEDDEDEGACVGIALQKAG
ncbi:hypothetical protein BDV95DRAFT_398418 [Massariosphaeria phaeospora]|uniref:Uncharacterized protein n=1 Tax=Massariosphaeria phaeospora TaxID=100035 RepID=A0A7C8IH55_9PLEO|nr:hypothetical protein BDV95DRAFT_398418 [Massariosphaeria phaeospora]